MSRPIEVGDEVIRVEPEKWRHPSGRVIGLVQGGYEVRMHGTNCLVYENDETIELRYPDE